MMPCLNTTNVRTQQNGVYDETSNSNNNSDEKTLPSFSYVYTSNRSRRMTPVLSPQQSLQAEQFNEKQHFTQQPPNCIYHSEMPITNFCKKSLMPLCPKCITSYLQQQEKSNQPVQIENIDKIQSECKASVQSLENLYASDLESLKQACSMNSDLKQSFFMTLNEEKKKVMDLVNSYFDSLEYELNACIPSASTADIEKIVTMAEGFAKQKCTELHGLNSKLDGPKYLKYIMRLLNNNYFEEYKHHHDACSEIIQGIQKKLPQLHSDQNRLNHIKIELAKFLSIKNHNAVDSADLALIQLKYSTSFPNQAITSSPKSQSRVVSKSQTRTVSYSNYGNSNASNSFKKNMSFQLFSDEVISSYNSEQQPNKSKTTYEKKPEKKLFPLGVAAWCCGPSYNSERTIFPRQNQRHIPKIKDEISNRNQNRMQMYFPKDQSIILKDNLTATPVSKSLNNSALDRSQSFLIFVEKITQNSKSVENKRTVNVNSDYFERFCHEKYIHYFVPGTNLLYFIDIDTHTTEEDYSKPRWQHIQLKHNFTIPNGSQSIVTPKGDIYLIGGIDAKSNTVQRDCFKVNLTNQTLELQSKMITPRFLHSSIYFRKNIYSLGGFDAQHNMIDKCERWNLSEKKWVSVSPMTNACAQMGVCVFKNKYILTFGVGLNSKINLIQFYDPTFDTWQEIILSFQGQMLPKDFYIRPACGVVTINDNGTILVFGGDESSVYPKTPQIQTQSPNNFVLILKSETGSLHFSVWTSQNIIELYNYPIVGQVIAQNGRISATVIQQPENSHKLATLCSGYWEIEK